MSRKKLFNQNVEQEKRVPLVKMKELRKKNNLSFDALSRLTGITSKHLWNIETGKSRFNSVTEENKKKICKALGVKVEELVCNM